LPIEKVYDQLPPPYQVNAIALLLTLRCNAECDHCCLECDPRRNEEMTRPQVLDYIDQIAAFKTIKTIHITGGEVFTAYDLLRRTVEAAGQYGIKSLIVTNGYWATSAKQAREKLAPLVDAGLTNMSVSYDAIHEKFVKPDQVKYALKGAHAMGIQSAIEHTSLDQSMPSNDETLFNSLGLPTDFPAVVSHSTISPGGRAIRNYPLKQLPLLDGYSQEGRRLHKPCQSVVRLPVITPNGDLSACCGVTVTTLTGFRKEFIVGNLKKHTLGKLLKKMEYDPLFTALMIEGPWFLYQHIRTYDPELFHRKRFLNICDLCAQVVLNRSAKTLMREILRQQEPRLLLKKMMLEFERQNKLNPNPST
jgi:hypothetical protein